MKTYRQFIAEIAEVDPNIEHLHSYMNTGEYSHLFTDIDSKERAKAARKAIQTAGVSEEPDENKLGLAKVLLHKYLGVQHPNLRGE